MLKILGIDASLTNTGICLIETDEKGKIQKYQTEVIQPISKGIQRLIEIEMNIEKYLDNINMVVIEDYAYNKKFRREVLGELQGIIKRNLFLKNIPFICVCTQYIKKILTGQNMQGADLKERIKKATQQNYGMNFETDHECEAFGLALIGKYYIEFLKQQCIYVVGNTAIEEQEIVEMIKKLIWKYNREFFISHYSWEIIIEHKKNKIVLHNPDLQFKCQGKTIQECLNKFKEHILTTSKTPKKSKQRIIVRTFFDNKKK